MAENQGTQVGIVRVYVKDISFESPLSPQVFTSDWRPEIKLDVRVTPKKLGDSYFEVTLGLSAEAKEGEKVGFIVEVEHAILLDIRNVSQEQLDQILHVFAPTTVFPYARQAVDQLLVLGGFAPLMLAPINFQAVPKNSN